MGRVRRDTGAIMRERSFHGALPSLVLFMLAACGSGSALPDASNSDGPLACLSGETNCENECVDLMANAQHCGACAKSCGGGACAGGDCQSYALIAGVDRPWGIDAAGDTVYFAATQGLFRVVAGGAATLIAPNNGAPFFSPTPVVEDGGQVFWGGNGNLLLTVPAQGTTVALGAIGGPGNATTIATDSNNVYWISNIGVMRAPRSAGPAMLLIDAAQISAIAVANGNIFWAGVDGTSSTVIERMSLSGVPMRRTLVDNLESQPAGMVVDGNFVYWSGGDSMWRMSIEGDVPERLAVGPSLVGSVVLSEGELFWVGGVAGGGGVVMSVPIEGGPARQRISGLMEAAELAVTSSVVLGVDFAIPNPIGTPMPQTGRIVAVAR